MSCRLQPLASIIVFLMAVPVVRADVVASSPALPPQNGEYVTPPNSATIYNVPGGPSVVLQNLILGTFSQSTLPPLTQGGQTVDMFTSLVTGSETITVGPNGTGPVLFMQPINASANVTMDVIRSSPTGGPEATYNTQMTQLDINLTPGGLIRIDPITASTGQTTISDAGPPGMFQISSFFDVFTDISLDGGQTWTPSANPTRIDLAPPGIPEPSSIALLGLAGAMGWLGRRFRRKNR